jgi:integrase/recombinase XerD
VPHRAGAAQRAGIGKAVSPHFLRHAHASHALERGVKVTVIRDTLGHSSIAITGRYVHARPDESSGLALAVSGDRERAQSPIAAVCAFR